MIPGPPPEHPPTPPPDEPEPPEFSEPPESPESAEPVVSSESPEFPPAPESPLSPEDPEFPVVPGSPVVPEEHGPLEPTTAERRAARSRRQRHRDLPAKVRRRQAIAATVIVVVLGLGIYALASAVFGGGGGSSKSAQVSLQKLVGQTVVGKLPRSGPNKAMLKRVRLGKLGGVIVNPANSKSLKADTAKLQQAAAAGDNPPLLIAIDQEGGPVKRLPGPPQQSAAQLGKLGDEDVTKGEGQDTGKFLSSLGVNVDLAPVADVSHPGTAKSLSSRTFGSDPGDVAKQVVAFADGLGAGGAAATVKHFPGLGFAKTNTDFGAAKITTERGVLEGDIEPFQSAIDNGVPMVMTSTATYTAFDAKNPAAWSQAIIGDELRDKLGFDGVVITDDLEGAAVTNSLKPEQAALRSLAAGGDMVLFAKGAGTSSDAYKTLLQAANKGQLSRDTLQASYDRITALKDGFST
jgi:beta-N-acetylhexosaminidase